MFIRGKFTARYDHTFPNRSMVTFRAGWSGPVKEDVARKAIAAGKFTPDVVDKVKAPRGRPPKKPTTPPAPETLPGNLPVELAEPQALTPNLHEAGQSD